MGGKRSVSELIMTVFVEQPLALPGSAKEPWLKAEAHLQEKPGPTF